MNIKAKKILENSGFFKHVDSNLYLDPLGINLIEEERKNEVSLGLEDSKKDIISIKDLKFYFDEILEKKKKFLKKNNVKEHVIFHLWYDYQLGWLRYTFFTKTKKSTEKWKFLEKCCESTDGWELVKTKEKVLEMFLNDRSDGCFKIKENGMKYFHNDSLNDEIESFKIYEEELISE